MRYLNVTFRNDESHPQYKRRTIEEIKTIESSLGIITQYSYIVYRKMFENKMHFVSYEVFTSIVKSYKSWKVFWEYYFSLLGFFPLMIDRCLESSKTRLVHDLAIYIKQIESSALEIKVVPAMFLSYIHHIYDILHICI